MSSEQQHGVVFPMSGDGRRSTTAVGRAVVADALRPATPPAPDAEQETNWRSGYLRTSAALVEAGLDSSGASPGDRDRRAGLAARPDAVVDGAGDECRSRDWAARAAGRLETRRGAGTGSAGDRAVAALPRPAAARRRPARAARRVGHGRGARAVGRRRGRAVLAQPRVAAPDGRTVAVLGAGAEMGPLQALLRWGARVAAVDLPRPRALGAAARDRPRRAPGRCWSPPAGSRSADLERRAGADLLADAPAVADWLGRAPGRWCSATTSTPTVPPTCGSSVAVDALTTRLQERPRRPRAGVPGHPDRRVRRARRGRGAGHPRLRGPVGTRQALGRPLRALSAGDCCDARYVRDADPGINDSLVPQQGPNYALAKRLQRWRAASPATPARRSR